MSITINEEKEFHSIHSDDVKEQAKQNYEDTLQSIDNKYGHGFATMDDIQDMAKEMLETIPKLDRNKLREEMDLMHVEVYPEPTTFNINEGLAKAQGYKERLAGILVQAQREYNVRNKVWDMLAAATNVMSKLSSADKRKGEAIMKYSAYFLQLEAAETFMEEVQMYMNNMKATGEAISRQASVLQSQIQLNEIRRKPNISNDDINSPAEEISEKDLKWN